MVRFLLRYGALVPLAVLVIGLVILLGQRGRTCRSCFRWVPKNERCPCGQQKED